MMTIAINLHGYDHVQSYLNSPKSFLRKLKWWDLLNYLWNMPEASLICWIWKIKSKLHWQTYFFHISDMSEFASLLYSPSPCQRETVTLPPCCSAAAQPVPAASGVGRSARSESQAGLQICCSVTCVTVATRQQWQGLPADAVVVEMQ
jgi:hypothetical protein